MLGLGLGLELGLWLGLQGLGLAGGGAPHSALLWKRVLTACVAAVRDRDRGCRKVQHLARLGCLPPIEHTCGGGVMLVSEEEAVVAARGAGGEGGLPGLSLSVRGPRRVGTVQSAPTPPPT